MERNPSERATGNRPVHTCIDMDRAVLQIPVSGPSKSDFQRPDTATVPFAEQLQIQFSVNDKTVDKVEYDSQNQFDQ